ncbi:MAG: 4Fe-4S binding protein [Desulfovibrio sp.]|nr:4Fe-4S binding protein [Desulfovibrio sp.]
MTPNTSQPLERMRDLFPQENAGGKAARNGPRLVFDPTKCSGCALCTTACQAGGKDADSPRTPRIRIFHDSENGSHFALFCQHCLDPQCLRACPNAAISRAEDGIVRINQQLCVHCGLCIAACPEGAPFRAYDGTVVKCDLCEGDPACVAACPNEALVFTRGQKRAWISPLRWLCQSLSFFLLVIVLIGSVCSLNLATLDIACPFGVLQNVFSAKAIVGSTIVAALLLMLVSVLFGRAFCGWICPFGFVLDLVDSILPHKLFRLPAFLRRRINKLGVGAGGLAAAGLAGTQAFCSVCPIGTVCRSYGLNSVMAGAETALIPALAALDLSERRSWCRYLCPVGATLGLAAKIGLVRIEIGAERCKKFSCMRCADACPMGIIPKEMLVQGISPKIPMSECITCLRCVAACPHRAASIRFVWQKKRTPDGTLPKPTEPTERNGNGPKELSS